MKYRDAKKLQSGDEVKRKSDGAILLIKEVEVFGQYKKVRFTCDISGTRVVVYHDEVE